LEVTKSDFPRVLPEPLFAATGYCSALFSRASKNVPEPCISVAATYAFQYGTEPNPVHVCRFTPAKPNAGGISVQARFPSGRRAFPSLSSSASKQPGPQLPSTFFSVVASTPRRSVKGLRFGASEMIAPTFRSRLAHPSRRLPMQALTNRPLWNGKRRTEDRWIASCRPYRRCPSHLPPRLI